MIRSLWISKTGLDAQQTQLDVISNNLANVGSNGFKRVRAVFEDLLYQTVRQPGAASSQQTTVPSGVQVGTGVRTVSTVRNFGQGNLMQTGNPLDLAINGQGFLQVQLPDGGVAYTRDGSLHLDAQGQLVTANGMAISPGMSIPAGAQALTVAPDGTVSVALAGSATPQQIGQVQLANFANPSGLQALGQNLFVETASSGAPTSGSPGSNGLGVVTQGYVETSNVNVVEELVNMIQTQRAFEINSKAVQTSDQMLQRLAQL